MFCVFMFMFETGHSGTRSSFIILILRSRGCFLMRGRLQRNSTCRPATFYWRHWRLLATKMVHVEAVEIHSSQWKHHGMMRKIPRPSRPRVQVLQGAQVEAQWCPSWWTRRDPRAAAWNGIFVSMQGSGSKVVFCAVCPDDINPILICWVYLSIALTWCCKYCRGEQRWTTWYMCMYQCKKQKPCSTRTIEWIYSVSLYHIVPTCHCHCWCHSTSLNVRPCSFQG